MRPDAAPETPPETLFLATIPGATPSTWVQRFTSRERTVQLVNHDESAQALHLRHDAAGAPLHPLPQLGYLRWLREGAGAVPGDEVGVGAGGEAGAGVRAVGAALRGFEATLRAAGVDPRFVHAVTVYTELPVVCVGRDHLLAAWDAEADGPVPLSELDPDEELDPARFAPAPSAPVDETGGVPGTFVDETGDAPGAPVDETGGSVTTPVRETGGTGPHTEAAAPNPMDTPEVPGAGERMALEIAATGVGHVVLPMSVARMFGRKDVVVLPLACELDETVGMSRADREAAATRAEIEAGRAAEPGADVVGQGAAHDDGARHPGWDVALAWLKEADSPLVQAFVGVARGRRGGSSR
ncbi:hypothetical protein [Micrococcus sp.]|uniref:hypothetical protein n=1 Tax=Micrococcus sp. TaxID=1271 RepID=UPI002A90E71B|nr:hypothetical protein [Micrococcus sp.]MDY6055982.1 hypothetical protein [Micrococcus sp.]